MRHQKAWFAGKLHFYCAWAGDVGLHKLCYALAMRLSFLQKVRSIKLLLLASSGVIEKAANYLKLLQFP